MFHGPLAADIFVWWQLPILLLLIAVIVGWIMYRKRQK